MADYTDSGFDSFLSRSIDNVQQSNLDSQAPQSQQIAYDRTQVSGFVGDSIQLGGVRITPQGIIMNDGNNDVLLIGDEQ